MAKVIKTLYEGYMYYMHELADPRTHNIYPFLVSPVPISVILFLWHRFVFKWGPEYMKNRKPFELKKIMIAYNICQVMVNSWIFYGLLMSIHVVNWTCTPVDYSESYWGISHLTYAYYYFILKILDLLDTVFFVLRKKDGHLSFLHTYHHFAMALGTWYTVKYFGGGHIYFIGLANTLVHAILYSYYLLTAYDSKYGKLLWLKKSITTIQLVQFVFFAWSFTNVLLRPTCKFSKLYTVIVLPQNVLMIVLFGNFYFQTYIRAKQPPIEKAETLASNKNRHANIKTH
ncbi:elongation of very long chain fatty acids protein 1 [Dendroctonus ponderosae]|uniref:Elongation of very long chain fatty acids protein n=1 Tax=Dendroctonus ponderosae TaxID=77166 RepID=U4UEN3_DENPD|nr:elongation of very long chain fatty acids protein 1 [Dendroctonus ponderosae]ERL88360.1 hypothetical protein D910_05747 [Dendroctonus ponderosae]KAH1017765.1 hypothetical protein HUJ05_008362 [Dendroctonus ponderosae]